MTLNSRPIMKLVAGLVLFVAATFGRADEAKQEPDDQKDLNRLAAIWQANLSEIKSAHIRYRSLARPPSKIATRDAMLKLLETSDFVNRPDDARLLSKTLGLEIPPEHAAWGNGELYVTGTKIRVNSDYEGSRVSELVLIDTNQIVASRVNSQIDIYSRKNGSRRHVKSLDDLRIIPRLDKQPPATIEKRSVDGLVMRIGIKQLLVDEGTGFVHSVIQDSIQRDPTHVSGGHYLQILSRQSHVYCD
jgi:hypothetical protein